MADESSGRSSRRGPESVCTTPIALVPNRTPAATNAARAWRPTPPRTGVRSGAGRSPAAVHPPLKKRKEKNSMTSYPNPNDFVQYKTRRQMEGCVQRAISALEHENTVLAQSPIAVFQRLLKVYKQLKPLLVFLTTFPLVPQSIRTGVGLLVQMLDSVSEASPTLTTWFKAGKDL